MCIIKNARGLSLIELVIYSAITGIVLVAATTLLRIPLKQQASFNAHFQTDISDRMLVTTLQRSRAWTTGLNAPSAINIATYANDPWLQTINDPANATTFGCLLNGTSSPAWAVISSWTMARGKPYLAGRNQQAAIMGFQ